MTVVEQELCAKIVGILRARLPDVVVDGNWLPMPTKGAVDERLSRLDVTVGPRSYGEFTSLTADMEVRLEGAIPVGADTTADRSIAAYSRIVELVEEWHGSIAAVKRDLTLDGFDPVGLRLAGGTFELDRETKARYYSQTFAVRGRIKERINP